MQYETRWCIKQHSHLFYYTWNEEEIYGTFHITWTTSCTLRAVRGWTQKLQLPGLIEKANTWAQACLLCAVPMKDRNCNIRGARHQGCSCFRAVLQVPWERTAAADPDHFRLTLQSSRIHTVDWCFLKCMKLLQLFPICTLLSKPLKRKPYSWDFPWWSNG